MTKDSQKSKRLTNLELNILTYLEMKPNINTIKQMCSFWEMDKSDMYKTLNKLKANLLITSTKEDEPKYYVNK